MDDLLAQVGVYLELGRFLNVDLFEKGHYAVRCTLRPTHKRAVVHCASSIHSQRQIANGDLYGNGSSVPPPTMAPSPMPIVPDRLVCSRSQRPSHAAINACQVAFLDMARYSKEACHLDTAATIDLVLPYRLYDSPQGVATVTYELLFHEEDPLALKAVASHTLVIHGAHCRRRAWAQALTFDYLHTASIDTQVHAYLLGLTTYDLTPERDILPILPDQTQELVLQHAVQSYFGTSQSDVSWEAPHRRARMLYKGVLQHLNLGGGQLVDLLVVCQDEVNVDDVTLDLSTLTHQHPELQTGALGPELAENVVRALLSAVRQVQQRWHEFIAQVAFNNHSFTYLCRELELLTLRWLRKGCFFAPHRLGHASITDDELSLVPLRPARSRRSSRTSQASSLHASLTSQELHQALASTSEALSPAVGEGGVASRRTDRHSSSSVGMADDEVFTASGPEVVSAMATSCLPVFACSTPLRGISPPPSSSARRGRGRQLRDDLECLQGFAVDRLGANADLDRDDGQGLLFVGVHGLGGNEYDLRLYRLELSRHFPKAHFHMASMGSVDGQTHASLDELGLSLLEQVERALLRHKPTHVSFLCHSLGTLVARTMLQLPQAQALFALGEDKSAPSAKPRLQLFLSLAGPHLGVAHLGGLVGAGMWLLSRFTRSTSIPQLELKDHPDATQTRVYKLSEDTALRHFAYVVLVASPQDGYVPTTSALLLPDRRAERDGRIGPAYDRMRRNLMGALIASARVRLLRIQVTFKPAGASLASTIGRAAHVALLDSLPFIRKLLASQLNVFQRDPVN
ncbi:uncharacterized protein MONBRDRAFT_10487 [Monosiga brevicollis MX1]|uniref:DUF676 domain-containing protein n=1 Tax=Monosiga brevicollis TaxID=81824 RepID=A9V6C2_MONBE|nr:uncharacterized protein MONBRDRAFT_10487 [Monosiga brevicollis MX1]EDQ87042.1 predicted protein [Monosiga brevicollis MX1]|eukprot:XP_001748281.1 hypothetical protein [Monosiga brevicollis MX1]